MTDGGQDFNLGHVVGDPGAKGDNGSTVWYTSTAPTYSNSKYTFTISNLTGKTGFTIAVNDLVFYSTYYYIVSTVNSTTVDCTTRVSIKGSDASVTIVDNLTSDSSTSVLSAKQGKVLNTNKIETSAIATSFGSTTSDSKVPSEKLTKTELDKKQDTLVSGTSIKTINNNSLLGSGNITIESGSDVDIVTSWETTPSDSKVASEKLVKDSLDGKLDNAISSSAVTVASNDTILIADYSDSNKVKRTGNILAGQVKDGTAHTNIGSSANDTQATINTDIDTALSGKQATLVSGTNIKTVNNESLLGSGNITIQGGSNVDVVTSWEQTLSDSKVPSEKLTKNSLDDKISKSTTTGLVKNDGTIDTTSYSTFDGNYTNLTNKPTIPSASSTVPSADTTSGSYGSGTSYARSNHTHPKSSLYAESSHTHTKSQITDFPSLSTVATSGSYSDLSNKPSIPSSSSDLSDGSSLVKTSSTSGLLKNDGSVDTNSYLTSSSISGMLTTSDVANNLTTTTSGKVLDARQGKALADLIGDAITYINQQVVIIWLMIQQHSMAHLWSQGN